jgi:hypothetical protein
MYLAISHPAAELYVNIDNGVEEHSGNRTADIIVGNRGDATNHENFDASLDVLANGQSICHATTNFVTPIGPGQSIRALRFELQPANRGPLHAYIVRASIHYWDRTRVGPQRETTIALPAGRAKCVALKPVQ